MNVFDKKVTDVEQESPLYVDIKNMFSRDDNKQPTLRDLHYNFNGLDLIEFRQLIIVKFESNGEHTYTIIPENGNLYERTKWYGSKEERDMAIDNAIRIMEACRDSFYLGAILRKAKDGSKPFKLTELKEKVAQQTKPATSDDYDY